MHSPLMTKRGKNFAETVNAVMAQKGPTMERIPLENAHAPEALLSKEAV